VDRRNPHDFSAGVKDDREARCSKLLGLTIFILLRIHATSKDRHHQQTLQQKSALAVDTTMAADDNFDPLEQV